MEYMWNISLSHHQVADMFIVCGVLYAVDHVDLRDTKIRFALDLYKNKLLDVDLPFTNPFRFTTSLGYNPRLKVDRWKMLLLSYCCCMCPIFPEFNNLGRRQPTDIPFEIPRHWLQRGR